ncbi:MAG: hypothetical protein ACR2OM_12605 [Aestuariivirgaceae bacterium]
MKALAIIFALVLLTLGLLSWLTPFPGGTPAIALGLTILIYHSERAANAVSNWRLTHDIFNRAITWMEEKVPARLGNTLRRTRPNQT